MKSTALKKGGGGITVTPPPKKKKKVEAKTPTRLSGVLRGSGTLRIITYDYKKQKPKEINVKMPEVADNHDLGDMLYASAVRANNEEDDGLNNNDLLGSGGGER